MTRLFFNYLRERMALFKYYKCLPVHRMNSDVYIVEYPKSGITWFSTLVANTNLVMSGKAQRATYYNIQQLIPDIHISREIVDTPVWHTPGFRFIKSHSEYCPYYHNVIYLVRNPVSVMSSYYRYCKALGLFSGELWEFVDNKTYGLDTWVRHVGGWLQRGESHQRVHLVKYEDLRENTSRVLQNMYVNLGFDVEPSIFLQAAELSSLDSMRESESHYKKYNPNSTLNFVGEARVKADVGKELEEYILEKTSEVRGFLGY